MVVDRIDRRWVIFGLPTVGWESCCRLLDLIGI